ncbi:MAG: hypothetical protein H6721_05420 [Sandaracinus sp.]|nr:hypothetical protein [Sandaracinus sp.]
MRTLLALAAFAAVAHVAVPSAHADDTELVPWSQRHAFDRDFGIGVYASGRAGYREAVGLGGEVRWEPFDRLGVDVFAEAFVVDEPGYRRLDVPIGFDLYVPFRVSEHVRLRPLAGFCSVFSFQDAQRDGVDDTHDVQFGVHGGAGLEVALGRFVSLTLDVKGIVYFGHDRYSGGWDDHVSDELRAFGVAQGNLGVMMRL